MTHDELLAEIDIELRGPSDDCWHNGARALRAVVELHKPKNFILQNGEVVEQWCTADNNQLVPYPCPTIKAIQSALQ